MVWAKNCGHVAWLEFTCCPLPTWCWFSACSLAVVDAVMDEDIPLHRLGNGVLEYRVTEAM